jgi:hypothetical protein
MLASIMKKYNLNLNIFKISQISYLIIEQKLNENKITLYRRQWKKFEVQLPAKQIHGLVLRSE